MKNVQGDMPPLKVLNLGDFLSMSLPEQEQNNFDKTTTQREVIQEKCEMMSELPGLEMTFDPHEADQAGAFQEDALSEEDAREAVFDEQPLPKDG